jgi:2-hydroxy-3-keto-5-methylthiopentenyl-1-phosphate phosphatase
MNFSSKKIFLCDFDGTVSDKDVCDEIVKNFSPKILHDYGRLYDKGAISHDELNRIFIKNLKITPSELKKFLKNRINIRRGFKKFVDYCFKNNYLLLIVSTGWDFYIKNVLSDFSTFFSSSLDLVDIPRGRLIVICNKINFNTTTKTWDIAFQFESNVSFSPDKNKILLYYKNFFDKVYVVGDGASDYVMALSADFVFSTNDLSVFCEKRGLFYCGFDNFDDIINKLDFEI